ncbi:proline-rich protein 2-like [Thalassophryne amazonica]|uniref:proline-rich protein 2-like n=1 Tax=Thalassophryne amazonica TaxID=390379 RepID=UPI001470C885|nr:proline-rich protein 2-like [Thalassophryne amazonica]
MSPLKGGAQNHTAQTKAPKGRSERQRGRGAKEPLQLNPKHGQGPPSQRRAGSGPHTRGGTQSPGPGSTRGSPNTQDSRFAASRTPPNSPQPPIHPDPGPHPKHHSPRSGDHPSKSGATPHRDHGPQSPSSHPPPEPPLDLGLHEPQTQRRIQETTRWGEAGSPGGALEAQGKNKPTGGPGSRR